MEDLKQICGSLSQLKNEMQTNKKLTDVPEDGTGDEALWNICLHADSQLQHAAGTMSAWFVSPWLLIECYFYRRIYSAIRLRFVTVMSIFANCCCFGLFQSIPTCMAANPPNFHGSLPLLRPILRLYDLAMITPDFAFF